MLAWGKDGIVVAIAVISMALIGKHWQNLQRLMAGTEPRLGSKKKPLENAPRAAKPR